ncbi:MAG TPA: AAA family ATPase [Lamprocystis sp. (in: g-proteobacteria)]|nr:AAA family ATPase [Lamprocystis sp. (in: g-proteobacteria)]
MNYQPKHFDLPADAILAGDKADDIQPYCFDEAITIAIDVALATGRPLLVSGNPGCGKSRLADAVAAVLGWSLLACTITSRTRAETLTAEVDQLRRLNDAQARQPKDALRPGGCYLEPGIFWWAFEPETARVRGLAAVAAETHQAELPYPGLDRTPTAGKPAGTVLLIDEIDKAEPDLPNDLLEPLDRRRFLLPAGFHVHRNGTESTEIQAPAADQLRLLTLITTNRERDLPQAFVRRCVLLEIEDPGVSRLVAIAQQHFPTGDAKRMEAIAKRLVDLQGQAKGLRVRAPNTAELLDAVRACEDLEIAIPDQPDPSSVWSHLERAVLAKDPDLRISRP